MQTQLSSESLQSPRSDQHIQGVSYPGDNLGLNLPKSNTCLLNAASRSTICNSPAVYIPCGFEPSVAEDDNLKTFKAIKLKRFPFIILPESQTAQDLRQERPFLWLCIMAVSSKSSVQQIALEKELRTIIGRQLLLEGEKTLDLLLGVMTYIAW
jgi:hypothetical protein